MYILYITHSDLYDHNLTVFLFFSGSLGSPGIPETSGDSISSQYASTCAYLQFWREQLRATLSLEPGLKLEKCSTRGIVSYNVVLTIHSALDFQFCRFIKSLSALFTNLLVFCRRCSQDSGLWLQYLLVPAGTLFRYLENSEAACGITYFGSNAWFCECFLQIPCWLILQKKRKLMWHGKITIFSI